MFVLEFASHGSNAISDVPSSCHSILSKIAPHNPAMSKIRAMIVSPIILGSIRLLRMSELAIDLLLLHQSLLLPVTTRILTLFVIVAVDATVLLVHILALRILPLLTVIHSRGNRSHLEHLLIIRKKTIRTTCDIGFSFVHESGD